MCLTICDVGSLTGSVILFPIAGLICEYGLDGKGFDGGWPAIFYIFGTLVNYLVNYLVWPHQQDAHQRGLGLSGLIHEEAHPTASNFS